MAEDTRPRARKRPNGEGSIYPYRGGHRGALTWTDAGGRQHRKTVSGKTQAEVRRALTKLRAELDEGRAPAPAASAKVEAFLVGWLEASRQRVRPATWRQYEQAVRLYLTPAIGRLELSKLTPSDVERLTANLITSGRSPRTAALARVVLRRALADAQRDGSVHRNVAALARPPHVPTRSLEAGRDYLDAYDLRRLVTASRVHPLGPLVTVLATTGLRVGEALGLTWADVDLEAATLTVRRSLARSWDGWALAEPKTARSRRTVHLPAAAVVALRRQEGLQEAARTATGTAWQDKASLVFTDAVGRPLRGHDVNHAFHRLLDAGGLPSVPLHGMRHTYATTALAGGVPLQVVSRALGHSSIAMTADRYGGIAPEQRREAASAIDRALAGS